MSGFRCVLARVIDDETWQLEVPMPPFVPFVGMDVVAGDVSTMVDGVSWLAELGLLVVWIPYKACEENYNPEAGGWKPATFWNEAFRQEAGNG